MKRTGSSFTWTRASTRPPVSWPTAARDASVEIDFSEPNVRKIKKIKRYKFW
jgi:hypothetical protein